MKKTIALVLPAYQVEESVGKSLEKLKKGTARFPSYEFIYYVVDDGSEDETLERVEEWKRKNPEIRLMVTHNEKNIGLVETLKQTYEKVIAEKPDYILKTDLDKDFDQAKVVETLVPVLEGDVGVIVGIRKFDLKKEQNEYEFKRRKEIFETLKRVIGETDLDPASSGSQLYERDALERILKAPIITSFHERWGLDFLIPLVASLRLGIKMKILSVGNSSYDPTRRDEEKVRRQYDTYTKILTSVLE